MGTTAVGAATQLLIQPEATFGTTPAAAAAKLVPYNKIGLQRKQNTIDPETITANMGAAKPARGNIDASGTITVPVDAVAFGEWLRLGFGAPTTTDGSTKGAAVGGAGCTSVVATWAAITSGAFTIGMGGVTQSVTVDFTGAGTMNSVAAIVQTGLQALTSVSFVSATVTWSGSATADIFTITAGLVGASSAITAMTSATAGTDITTMMKCRSADVTLTQGADIYSHLFVVPSVTAAQTSFVAEKGFTNIAKYELFNGCVLKGMKIGYGSDAELVCDFDVIGKTSTMNSASYDAAPTTRTNRRLNSFQASITEGGSGLNIVVDGDINVDFGPDDSLYLVGTSGQRGEIPRGKVTASGAMKVLFQDLTLLNKAINGTETALVIAFTESSEYSLTFTLDEAMYDCVSPPMDGPQGVKMDLPWRAYYDDAAAASIVRVTLVNNISSYA